MNSEDRKIQLKELIEKYKGQENKNMSEETIRGWINKMLDIFGWDTDDTSQVLQEKPLSLLAKEKLQEIDSSNSRPDYTFILGATKITFLDAKNITIDLKTCKKSAFQIKSYGWSIGAPCAFITNFEEFVIYDTTYIPNKNQNTNLGSIYISIDDYLEKFNILEEHLLKENIVNGILDDKYSDGTIIGTEKISLDDEFSKILSDFRLKLANDIFENNVGIIEYDINLYIQIILNRILFIRVCESRKLESEGLLNDFRIKGFWDSFKKSSYLEFFEKYDGPIFSFDDIKNIKISNELFDDFLLNLYYPSPYQFNVIPTHILSDIYELFLGKKMKIFENKIIEIDNSLYEKSNGVVITPKYIVESLTKKTLDKNYINSLTINELLDLKIVDISCGSGVFLIEAYIILEEAFISKYSENRLSEFDIYFIIVNDIVYINQEGKRLIFNNCIFGVDINPESVEVTKMSLSLKVIDSVNISDSIYLETIKGYQILNGLGNNIKIGNSLVSSDILEKNKEILDNPDELSRIYCFNWKSEDGFKDVFDKKGGFDFIIGNPPYVEAKNYNSSMENMHKYLNEKYFSITGKADLLIVFIEKSIQLLNPKGKMGYVIQNRFFKTQNGQNIRKIITDNKLLDLIINFKSNDIFKGKNTYISYLILNKDCNSNFLFKEINGKKSYLEKNLLKIINDGKYIKFDKTLFNKEPWALGDLELLKLKDDLNIKFGTLGEGIYKIGVGIQTLWNKAFQIKVIEIKDNIIYGKTKLGGNNIYEFELNSCAKIIENTKRFSFQETDYERYTIFPYNIINGKRSEILWSDFLLQFPKTSSYLSIYKEQITSNVEFHGIDGRTNDINKIDNERWHLFTRTSNIEYGERKKIAIPSVTMNTIGVFMKKNTYCDNSNITFLDINSDNEKELFGLAGIINSNLFSNLGKLIALEQSGGYYKFNKQCLEKIPFPKNNFFENKNDITNKIYNCVNNIINFQKLYMRGKPKHIKIVLNTEWIQLNNLVLDLYEITDLDIREDFLQEIDINNRIN